MNCQKCGSGNVLVEGVGEGKTKVTCQACGVAEVKDQQGRKMLTDDRPAPDRRELLTS
jgi:hypothetical protein